MTATGATPTGVVPSARVADDGHAGYVDQLVAAAPLLTEDQARSVGQALGGAQRGRDR